jgi:hypothetical protein
MIRTLNKLNILLLLKISLLLAMFFAQCAFAGKYDILFGAYSASGSGSGKSTSISGVGSFEMSYLIPFKEHYEVSLGYNYTVIGSPSRDYSYGPKVGINYFPFNFSSNEKITLPNKTIEVVDFFKPYIGLSFNQKQYVATKTFFAGFGLSAGFEKNISSNYTLKSEVKYKTLAGSSNSTLSEVSIMAGLVLGF